MPNKISVVVFLGDDAYGLVDIDVEAGATAALADVVLESITSLFQLSGAELVSDRVIQVEPVL